MGETTANRNAAGSPGAASSARGEEIAGIRYDAVARFFTERVPGATGPLRFSLISGGRSNLTYRVEDGSGNRWVLRRPPLGHVLPTAHDMTREFRVLSALAGTDVPVARPVALCEDGALNDAPFYVLALYKLAVISEGIYARWKLGQTLGDGFDTLGRAAAPLAERALAIAEASSDPKLRG